MRQIAITLDDESATERLGRILARTVPDGTTIALTGTLAAGKTRLTQAIAVACGVNRHDVVSPTFVLCQQYVARRMIYHLDAYRIGDDDEFYELGVDEFFDSPAITIVEWADRVADCLPAARLEIDLRVLDGTCREANVQSIGGTHDALIATIQQQWQN